MRIADLAALALILASSRYGRHDEVDGPQMSPNAQWRAVAHTSWKTLPGGAQTYGPADIVLIQRGSKRRHVLWSDPGGDREVNVAAWSWDSRYLFFWTTERGSSSANADGSPLYMASTRSGHVSSLGWMMRRKECFQWSHNRYHLLLVMGGSRFFVENKRLVLLNLLRGTKKMLTGSREAASDPAWSPDGRWIAYLSVPDPGPTTETDSIHSRRHRLRLWVIRTNGSGARKLTSDARYFDIEPHWTPDGSRIRFTRLTNDDAEAASEWEIRPDGTGLRQVKAGSAGRETPSGR